MEDNTFDLNDLPEEVVDEILAGEVIEIAPEELTADQEVIVEEVVETPVEVKKPTAKKKKTDNEIIDELVVAAEKKVTKKAPGMYYEGVKITKVLTNIGSKWTVMLNGKRTKVLRSKIEIIK